MPEKIQFPFSFEIETKIQKLVDTIGKSRDEVIAEALDSFLKSLGF